MESANLSESTGIFGVSKFAAANGTDLTGFYTYKKDHPVFQKRFVQMDDAKTAAFEEHLKSGREKFAE